MKNDNEYFKELIEKSNQSGGRTALVVAVTYFMFLVLLAWEFIAEHEPGWLVAALAMIASVAVMGGFLNRRMGIVATTLLPGFMFVGAVALIMKLASFFTLEAPTQGVAAQVDQGLRQAQSIGIDYLAYSLGAVFIVAAYRAFKPVSTDSKTRR
ncbi:hypothetical protein ISN36_19830 (plasmid) [Xanthomonas translucens pv. undulosa]|uniref:hypothetical protein n=1 Tax=Xanthomonas campestris pv. translucens TaxID=343 RepID=UPI0019D6BE88|nr:hypothetical protein [Xanthomonas translucens]QSQ54837.1 hypothetical protein ISN36_19830 [Xanthomonas translucens pv. undulosa]